MEMHMKALLLAVGVFAAITTGAAEFRKPVTFPRGAGSTVISGQVVRGDRDIYLLRVRSGQFMTIHISALEKNAAFAIYEPKTAIAIPGTEEESDATEWSGTLSKSGEYQIAVGGTRGNANYKLKISVK